MQHLPYYVDPKTGQTVLIIPDQHGFPMYPPPAAMQQPPISTQQQPFFTQPLSQYQQPVASESDPRRAEKRGSILGRMVLFFMGEITCQTHLRNAFWRRHSVAA